MPIDIPPLESWLSLDSATARRIALRAAEAAGGQLVEVQLREVGGRRGPAALITVGGTLFSLVPGGQVRLGYDALAFHPTRAELASFHDEDEDEDEDEDADEIVGDDHWECEGQLALFDPPEAPVEVEPDPAGLNAYLSARLTRPRTATLPHLLVAVDATEAGVERIPVDDEAVLNHLRRHPWRPGRLGSYEDFGVADGDMGSYVRVEYERLSGAPREAWRATGVTHGGIVASLAAKGWRLPTADEWEHAYGAGARTLFPWGERAFDTPGRPEPNLLGLRMATDSYKPELTSVRAEVRGGDLGVTACGGSPRFFHALLLAQSFRDPETVEFERDRKTVWHRLFRPVIEVSAPLLP